MTSLGVNEAPPSGPVFRIHGQIYHQIGSLIPSTDENTNIVAPKFAQIYIYGANEQRLFRSGLNNLNDLEYLFDFNYTGDTKRN